MKMKMTSFMINKDLDKKITYLINFLKKNKIYKYSSKADFIRKAILEKYFSEHEKWKNKFNEEPKTEYGKQALDYAKKAYINGDLKTLQDLYLNIKKMQDDLLTK